MFVYQHLFKQKSQAFDMLPSKGTGLMYTFLFSQLKYDHPGKCKQTFKGETIANAASLKSNARRDGGPVIY